MGMDTTSIVNFERWTAACLELGLSAEFADYRRMRRAWSGAGRHYHTVAHLDACLREFDRVRTEALRPAEVEMALWFHDAVYRSWRRDNEMQSASLARRMLRAAPIESAERICQMVLATQHHAEAFAGDTALVIDIDLSILGQSPEIYAQFERAIRREYWWVPRARFVAARVRVLQSFLERSAIYQHDPFYEKYEQQARVNMKSALAQLQWQ
jgi:predicted metal-dependent HD superfamily phosphohydrolase